jgi:nucleoside-diphosphate-sugar epimerase
MTKTLPFTVLGANGFIGKALNHWLVDRGHDVYAPPRHLNPAMLANSLHGNVVYCIGMTADFRSRPWDTVDAHITVLRHILAEGRYASLTYLSSTRVYLGCNSGHEDAVLTIQPRKLDQIFNLSKLMGESLCHTAHRPEKPVRVVRLSNVIGSDLNSDNFIYALLREARTNGVMNLKSSLDSSKDYIALSDVVRMLELISHNGQALCYNLASGLQTSNGEVVQAISKNTGALVSVNKCALHTVFPKIDILRIQQEFNFEPLLPMNYLQEILTEHSKTQ